jgi:hypothetical protein
MLYHGKNNNNQNKSILPSSICALQNGLAKAGVGVRTWCSQMWLKGSLMTLGQEGKHLSV